MTRHDVRTSQSHPIYVNWILDDELPGRVGLTIAPGKHGQSKDDSRPWARDLAADLDRLVAGDALDHRAAPHGTSLTTAERKKRYGMGLQVCLLKDDELVRLKIPRLVGEAQQRGIEVLRLPITDGGIPPARDDVRPLVAQIVTAAKSGKNVVIHCMGGIGRAGTIGGCVLVDVGFTADEALARLVERRGPNCPENPAQRAFIRDFA